METDQITDTATSAGASSGMNTPVGRTFLAVALGCVFLLVLGGCFGNGDDDEESPPTSSAEPAVSIVTTPSSVPVAPPTPTAQPPSTTVASAPAATTSTEAPLPAGDLTYTIQSGDTLAAIAERFGVDIQDLIDANSSLENPDVIFPGDVLTIPTG